MMVLFIAITLDAILVLYVCMYVSCYILTHVLFQNFPPPPPSSSSSFSSSSSESSSFGTAEDAVQWPCLQPVATTHEPRMTWAAGHMGRALGVATDCRAGGGGQGGGGRDWGKEVGAPVAFQNCTCNRTVCVRLEREGERAGERKRVRVRL
jgi:hypothetical protein